MKYSIGFVNFCLKVFLFNVLFFCENEENGELKKIGVWGIFWNCFFILFFIFGVKLKNWFWGIGCSFGKSLGNCCFGFCIFIGKKLFLRLFGMFFIIGKFEGSWLDIILFSFDRILLLIFGINGIMFGDKLFWIIVFIFEVVNCKLFIGLVFWEVCLLVFGIIFFGKRFWKFWRGVLLFFWVICNLFFEVIFWKEVFWEK